MTSINYNEFQAGQGVSAPDLNENFTLTNNAIESLTTTVNSAITSLTSTTNLKADKNGSSAEKFNVADATENTQAVNLGQLNEVTGTISPVGTVIWYAGSSVPSGYLLCDGSNISRTTYAALFAVIGVKFGAGDATTTFALPKLTDNRFIEGSSSAGTAKDAGLPSITGALNGVHGAGSGAPSGSGAFAVTSTGAAQGSADAYGNYANFSMDASRSSSIYGSSTTVQPKSLTLLPCIKY